MSVTHFGYDVIRLAGRWFIQDIDWNRFGNPEGYGTLDAALSAVEKLCGLGAKA